MTKLYTTFVLKKIIENFHDVQRVPDYKCNKLSTWKMSN